MKKFQSNVNLELRRAYPDRRRLETQCLSAVAFVRAENDILECPIWVLIINVVAMDMLKSKLPPGTNMIDHEIRETLTIYFVIINSVNNITENYLVEVFDSVFNFGFM